MKSKKSFVLEGDNRFSSVVSSCSSIELFYCLALAVSSFITDKVNRTQPQPKLWRRKSLTSLHSRPSHSQTIYVFSRPSRTFLTPDSTLWNVQLSPILRNWRACRSKRSSSTKTCKISPFRQQPDYAIKYHYIWSTISNWTIGVSFHHHFKDLRYFVRNYVTYPSRWT